MKTAVDNLSNSITSINITLGELSSRISKASRDNTRQDTAIEGKLDKTDYVVDTELSETSTNPVQNKILNSAFDTISDILDDRVKDIVADIPKGIMPSTGTAWAMVPNPEKTEVQKVNGGVRYTFNAALFATKEGLDSCLKKTDMTAITNEEIDAMF